MTHENKKLIWLLIKLDFLWSRLKIDLSINNEVNKAANFITPLSTFRESICLN